MKYGEKEVKIILNFELIKKIRNHIEKTRIESSAALWANDAEFISGYKQIVFLPKGTDYFEAQLLADIISMTSIKRHRTQLVANESSKESDIQNEYSSLGNIDK